MTVRVTLPPAAAKAAGNPANEAIDVQLGAGATAGDLLRELSDRLGPPFAPSLHGSGVDAGLRMFVNGLLALDDSDPLTTEGHEAPEVIVVLVQPMQGAATIRSVNPSPQRQGNLEER